MIVICNKYCKFEGLLYLSMKLDKCNERPESRFSKDVKGITPLISIKYPTVTVLLRFDLKLKALHQRTLWRPQKVHIWDSSIVKVRFKIAFLPPGNDAEVFCYAYNRNAAGMSYGVWMVWLAQTNEIFVRKVNLW